jgi:hypothetical protein
MTEEFKYGITGRVERDEDPINPRYDDNLGTMVCMTRNYTLGDVQGNPAEVLSEAGPIACQLILYLYDHSGITISTKPFSCQWDSGPVGVIYMTEAVAIDNFGKAWCEEQVKRCLEAEVEQYDHYLKGECYGYIVEDMNGETLDSCWGFIGDEEYCRSEMQDMAKWHIKQIDETKADRGSNKYLVTWEIDIEAGDPIEAAKKALAIHRDPDSIDVVFDVVDSETGDKALIDLMEVSK